MIGNSTSEHEFVKRLTKIVEANLQNEQFGVNELAAKTGLSRSHIHRRLKSISNKSVSQFIREVRLEKAKEFLEEGNLTGSEIAWKVGFSSPSYFIKSFHDYFGYPPGEYAKHTDEQGKNQELTISSEIVENQTKFFRKRKLMVWALVLLFVPLLFLAIRYFFQESGKTDLEKSVAVLPFKNLSDDSENRYFADGIMDDMLNHLSHIEDFRVISRTSTEKYRNSEKSLAQISKELGVSYIIEGSVQKFEKRVKIIIQLNDYNGNHIWSESFDRELDDIFSLQSEIAQLVASNLETVLSPQEIEQIEKQYTDNPEAYDLYLQGRFYHRLRTKESFQKSLEYHNKALELDSNYCLAYAGLADVYVTSTWFGNFTRDEGIPKSRAYALKALSIEKNLAEAHATLGAIAIYFDNDWEIAEKELKLAMTLNPQYPRAYHLYAQYLTVIGKEEEAHFYLNKALELDPSDRQLNWHNYYLYRREGNYDKALEFSDKIRFIDGNEKEYYRRNLDIYLRQNNITKVIEEFKNFQSKISSGVAPEMVDSIYAEKGKDGFIRFIIEFELKKSELFPYEIAAFYSTINEKDSAITYLERSFESGHGGLVRALGGKEFDNFRSEPGFKELIRKTNLEDIDFTQ
ncbi:MAG: helix-turn-helix domain-containing protein [Mariniphaga sp.]|nr:helix-turn-helix domain-containing protein [Mariniphaga sp.]